MVEDLSLIRDYSFLEKRKNIIILIPVDAIKNKEAKHQTRKR